MLTEIFLALIQSVTEFLPVSSSGHLALVSNLFNTLDLKYITFLHLASLLAVIIYTRKEIGQIIIQRDFKLGLYVVIATIPAAIIGLLYKDSIELVFSSNLFLGFAFIFTGIMLFITKFFNGENNLSTKNAFIIGLAQCLALLPGVSRSGMTISMALILGIQKEISLRFSFLMLIPAIIGAAILELNDFTISAAYIVGFFITLLFSLIFLKVLDLIVKKDRFWVFSIYCFTLGVIVVISQL